MAVVKSYALVEGRDIGERRRILKPLGQPADHHPQLIVVGQQAVVEQRPDLLRHVVETKARVETVRTARDPDNEHVVIERRSAQAARRGDWPSIMAAVGPINAPRDSSSRIRFPTLLF